MRLLLSSHFCNTRAFYSILQVDPALWPSGFFYTVQQFLPSDILRCIGITRKKKVCFFLSLSLSLSLSVLLGVWKI